MHHVPSCSASFLSCRSLKAAVKPAVSPQGLALWNLSSFERGQLPHTVNLRVREAGGEIDSGSRLAKAAGVGRRRHAAPWVGRSQASNISIARRWQGGEILAAVNHPCQPASLRKKKKKKMLGISQQKMIGFRGKSKAGCRRSAITYPAG